MIVVSVGGCLLLIVLAAIRPLFRRARLPHLLALLLALGLWLIVVNLLLPLSYRDSPAGGLVSQGIQKLDHQSLARAQYVFVIEGSSVTTNGLDGSLVESLVNQKGIPAIVIQLSASGANHAERLEFLREFVDALTPDQLDGLRRAKLVLCREVELGYDKNPLNGFLRNGPTDRSLRYLGPCNLPVISAWLALKHGPFGLIKRHTTVTEFIGYGLFNLFHVGYLARPLDFQTSSKTEPFIPNDTQSKGFAPKEDLCPPASVLNQQLAAYFSRNLPWLRQRDRDFSNLFRGLVRAQCYFACPSWFHLNSAYYIWKTQTTRDRLFFNGEQTSLVNQLNDPALWYDELHLQRAGAKIFSEAFAEYLVERIRAGDI